MNIDFKWTIYQWTAFHPRTTDASPRNQNHKHTPNEEDSRNYNSRYSAGQTFQTTWEANPKQRVHFEAIYTLTFTGLTYDAESSAWIYWSGKYTKPYSNEKNVNIFSPLYSLTSIESVSCIEDLNWYLCYQYQSLLILVLAAFLGGSYYSAFIIILEILEARIPQYSTQRSK